LAKTPAVFLVYLPKLIKNIHLQVMKTIRPAVAEDDGYIQKLIKYIPVEVIAAYTAMVGYLAIGPTTDIPVYKIYYLVLLAILFIASPVWTYFAVLDDTDENTDQKKKRALFHSAISGFAFLIWVYATGNPLLQILLCKCTTANCSDCAIYSHALGSMILVLFTLVTPLLERIILGKKL